MMIHQQKLFQLWRLLSKNEVQLSLTLDYITMVISRVIKRGNNREATSRHGDALNSFAGANYSSGVVLMVELVEASFVGRG